MKDFRLKGNYDRNRVSILEEADMHNFRRLLKGGNATSDILYITPVDVNCVYACKGFAIEHHQIFFSGDEKGVGNYYIVFRSVPILRSAYGNFMYVHYSFSLLNLNQVMQHKDKKVYFGIRRRTQPTYDPKNDVLGWRELKLPE